MSNHVHGGDVYRHRNVTDFSSNCNPFGTPESVKKAVSDAMEHIADYPDVECERLRAAIGAYENLPPEYIRCGNGAADLIFSIALALKPKTALLPAPTFAEYEQALTAVGCDVKHYYTKDENGFIPDRELIEKVNDGIDIVFFCNPNNPTGVLAGTDYVTELLNRCREKNTVLVLDECFVDFVDNPEANTLTGVLKDYNNLVILKAFTKRYAMAGIRLGYALCSNAEIMEGISRVSQPWNVSIPAQYAGIAALRERKYVETTMKNLHDERSYLKNAITDAGYKTYSSSANYIFFKGPEGLYDFCLGKGILIRDCGNYEGLETGYYRVAVKLRADNEKLVRVLEEAVKVLK